LYSRLYIKRGNYVAQAIRDLKISNRIHVFRAEQRITQQQLADAIGVTRGTIVAIEKGDYNPFIKEF
jgi:putative transcriptional regulator